MAVQDMTAIFKDISEAFPVDMSAFEGAYKNTTALNEKLTNVALEAVEKSTEISAKWTKETVAKLNDLSKAKDQPADYAKAMTDFASAQADGAAEHMAAFADVVKKAQMATVEIMMAAGKNFGEEANAAVEKATKATATANKKAASTTAK